MRYLSLTVASAALLALSPHALAAAQHEHEDAPLLLFARQTTNDEQTYLNSVCLPNTTSPIPPCQAITNIESACIPNGTQPIDYIAHQECMCGGGYFANWLGCLNCLYIHGGRSQAQSIVFSQVLTSASNMLCTGTPTTSFAAIFSSLSDAHPVVASTAATGMSDQFPSQTAVSLYYTAGGPQGAGAITGSATAATRDLSSAPVTATGSGAGVTVVTGTVSSAAGGAASSGTGTASAATTKTSSSLAGATNVLGGLLGLGVVANVVVMAAL